MFSMIWATRILVLAGALIIGWRPRRLRKRPHPGIMRRRGPGYYPRRRGIVAIEPGRLVQRVIDGDTVVLADGERVRYIGMDTPERGERLFDEATAYNRRLVEGQRVGLLKDQSETDRFGRLLRYVLAGDILVNAELVREGLAEAKRYDPDVKFADCFDTLMQEARENRRGLWGALGEHYPRLSHATPSPSW